MKKGREYFELKRKVDGLVYEFDLQTRPNGSVGYKRRDQDLWINWHETYGWVAWDGISDYIGGRPWYALPKDQSNYPPEGLWVSMKGEKSYVYELVYPSVNEF